MSHRNLFAIAQALNQMDATVLSEVPLADVEKAGEALELEERFKDYSEHLQGITKNDRKKIHFESKRAQASTELTIKYLLPAMLDLDANLDQVFERYTGVTLRSVLRKLRFETGVHDGWYGLIAHYQNMEIVITDSTPDYPRILDCEVSLTPTDLPESAGYVLVIQDGIHTLDATHTLEELMKAPSPSPQERNP